MKNRNDLSFGSTRPSQGHSFIEIALISMVVATLAMFCVNVAILMLGAGINDAACRDAARAAAQASSPGDATTFAKAALAAYTSSPVISQPELDAIDYQPPQLDEQGLVDKLGKPPFVRINTKLTVKVPAPFLVIGVALGEGGSMTFKKSYRYPIISLGEGSTIAGMAAPVTGMTNKTLPP